MKNFSPKFNYDITYNIEQKRGEKMLRLGCKAIGLAALMFCLGIICGMVFPIYLVAVLETILIVLIGYCCLFRF